MYIKILPPKPYGTACLFEAKGIYRETRSYTSLNEYWQLLEQLDEYKAPFGLPYALRNAEEKVQAFESGNLMIVYSDDNPPIILSDCNIFIMNEQGNTIDSFQSY